MKTRIFSIVLSILVLLSCNGPAGHSYDNDGITVIDLHGSWYQMGRQYGLLAKEQITDVLEYLDGRIGPDEAQADSARVIADALFELYPDYLKEFFDGASRTSGLSIERLKLCNAAEYVKALFHCSAMAVWGDYSSGKLVFGRNYDAADFSEISKDLLVTVYHPDDGIAAATVGYAGEIYCVNGMNEKGIFIELNNGNPSAGSVKHWDLCPSTTELFKLLFEAECLDDADDFFEETRSFGSFIIGVADREEARSYEWCFEGVRRGDLMTEDGLMLSTNHYVNGTWAFDPACDETSWNSITRRSNLHAQANRFKGMIDVEKMEEIMSTPLEEGGPLHCLTRYQIVAVPEDLALYINVPDVGRWVGIDMGRYLSASAR